MTRDSKPSGSTETLPPLSELCKGLFGQPCWNVRQGHGSFLTLEFGQPRLEVREPLEAPGASPRVRQLLARRQVTVGGGWHLWIYCCGWRLSQNGEDLAWWSSVEEKVEVGCRELDGQALREIVLSPDRGAARFRFDLGGIVLDFAEDDHQGMDSVYLTTIFPEIRVLQSP